MLSLGFVHQVLQINHSKGGVVLYIFYKCEYNVRKLAAKANDFYNTVQSYFENELVALRRGVEVKRSTSTVVCRQLKSDTAMLVFCSQQPSLLCWPSLQLQYFILVCGNTITKFVQHALPQSVYLFSIKSC